MLLRELSEARGPSGNESAVRELLMQHLSGAVDEHRTDALGNLLCFKRGTRPDSERGAVGKVMLSAHMDEVGFMVTAIHKDGTLRVDTVGGLDPRVLLSRRVVVGEDAVPGVIGGKPIHLTPADERTQAPKLESLAIDIGAKDKADAEKLVHPGDYVTFATTFGFLDSDGLRTVKGKAFDDRAGCAVLAQALESERFAFDLYGVFTTQEEVGLRGARVAAQAIQPDLAIALEGTICDDLPAETGADYERSSPVTEIGRGPAITLMDASFVADRRLVRAMTDTAAENDIPYQFKRAVAGGTDSGAIHLAGSGVACATLSVPCRYIHAPVSLLSLDDLDNAVRLLIATLHSIERGLPS